MTPGTLLALDLEKPTAGGRMLARHEGRVVLVWGGIPGERVRARIERTGKGVAFATTEEVLVPSPDRREVRDWRCGGSVLAHVRYPRQLLIKAEIVRDAFLRIGRLPLPAAPVVLASPETGYRLRARLHVRGRQIGFHREGSHEICAAAVTRQLAAPTLQWLARVETMLDRGEADGLTGVDLAETVDGGSRACHLWLGPDADPGTFEPLGDGLAGVSAGRSDRPGVVRVCGNPVLTDVLRVGRAGDAPVLRLRRDVRSFFQGNRFLLPPMVARVIGLVPDGPVLDLYAGVGLFGLALAVSGVGPVTLVEGNGVSGADLEANAAGADARVRVARASVEAFLRAHRVPRAATCLVDPPRTGLSREAAAGLAGARPRRIVYVSCDPPTLARDARKFVDAGYALSHCEALDLFPNTAHVECIAVFDRDGA
jgi:23S rRNA (uracil1939-C5)-methyltransferase